MSIKKDWISIFEMLNKSEQYQKTHKVQVASTDDTVNPGMPAWFKLWNDTKFEPRMQKMESRLDNIESRLDKHDKMVIKHGWME